MRSPRSSPPPPPPPPPPTLSAPPSSPPAASPTAAAVAAGSAAGAAKDPPRAPIWLRMFDILAAAGAPVPPPPSSCASSSLGSSLPLPMAAPLPPRPIRASRDFISRSFGFCGPPPECAAASAASAAAATALAFGPSSSSGSTIWEQCSLNSYRSYAPCDSKARHTSIPERKEPSGHRLPPCSCAPTCRLPATSTSTRLSSAPQRRVKP